MGNHLTAIKNSWQLLRLLRIDDALTGLLYGSIEVGFFPRLWRIFFLIIFRVQLYVATCTY